MLADDRGGGEAPAPSPGEPSPLAARVRGEDLSASTPAFSALLLVVFINILGFGVVVPLLPFYAESFHAPAWQIALIFSAFSLGSFFGEPFWGPLSDRIGRKPVLISTVTSTCLCYFLLAFAPNVYVAFFIRLVGGMCSGNNSVIQGYVADVTPREERSGRMGRMGAAFNVGFVVGPALGGLLARPELGPAGFRAPLLVASTLAALSAVSIAMVLKESRARSEAVEKPSSRWAMFGEALRHPVIGRVMLVTFVAGFAFTGIEATFGLWSQHRFGWGPRQVGACFGAVGVVSALAQWQLTRPLSRRFGEANMLAAGMALTATAAALQPFSTSAWTIVPLMMLIAIGQSVAFPNVSALISGVTHADRQGQALGLNNAMGALARVVGPLCASLVFAQVTVNGPFWLSTLIVLPAILLALAAGRAAKRFSG